MKRNEGEWSDWGHLDWVTLLEHFVEGNEQIIAERKQRFA